MTVRALGTASSKLVWSWAAPSIPAAVTSTTETAFAVSAEIPPGVAAALGTKIKRRMGGVYSSMGVTPTITPRTRLGGIALLPTRSIMGLLSSANAPWQSDEEYVLTASGWVGGGMLYIDDNQTRIIRVITPVAGPDMSLAQSLTASAQWGQGSCSITLHEMGVEVFTP